MQCLYIFFTQIIAQKFDYVDTMFSDDAEAIFYQQMIDILSVRLFILCSTQDTSRSRRF
jgi:hypothetical protein